MGLFKIPGQAYAALARILDLPGTVGLEGFQDEVIPTQDLTRMLQDIKVKRTLFQAIIDPSATQNTTKQWADASDWTEVQVNGITQVADDALPQPNQQRFITSVSLHVAGTQSHYTTAAVSRRTATTTAANILLASFGALSSNRSSVSPDQPALLPAVLAFEEVDCRFNQVVSGNDAQFNFIIEMISAERGVLHPIPGV